MNNLSILSMYYKNIYFLPKKNIYVPIQCGADKNKSLGILCDNTGKNISSENIYWSEITGLYWARYNYDLLDFVGLCSYRRFFNFKFMHLVPVKSYMTKDASIVDSYKIPDLNNIFSRYDIILPKYFVYKDSIGDVLNRTYLKDDIKILFDVVREVSPTYDLAIEQFVASNKMYGHNMFIVPKDLFYEYCDWVFNVLAIYRARTNPSGYKIQHIRLYGYAHEILLNIYVAANKLKVLHSQIDWFVDGAGRYRFNKISYIILAQLYFKIKKVCRIK